LEATLIIFAKRPGLLGITVLACFAATSCVGGGPGAVGGKTTDLSAKVIITGREPPTRSYSKDKAQNGNAMRQSGQRKPTWSTMHLRRQPGQFGATIAVMQQM
jgi:hypothetical protein